MSARGFRSISMVAGIAGAALGCYMVSLRVASERAALEDVEIRIVLAQRDIRVLQTEIGTRGRLAQLESWNVKVLALSAPQADQFVEGGFQLASMVAPKKTIDPAAPVVLASAPAPEPKPRVTSDGPEPAAAAPRDLMHVASLKRELPEPSEARAPAASPKPSQAIKPIAEKAKKTVEKAAPQGAAQAAKPLKAAKPAADSDKGARTAKVAAAKPAPVNTAAKTVTAKAAAAKKTNSKTSDVKPGAAKASTVAKSAVKSATKPATKDAKARK